MGDRLYFLRNERGLGVKNGTLAMVERIEPTLDGARLSDYGFSAVQAEANAAEAVIQAEIAKMPAAELRPIAAKLARADKLAEQEAAAQPRPSPSPW